ncbi:MAG TPA: flagellar biosynthetic protein FliR [Bryobacteraceae bacterium]|jgi:flagellar biosynthetic protein FliR|nr:flagellar biosynthetic protein FliR [Bryobacteraceae bacterium]
MPAELRLDLGTLYAFLLVLARVGGTFVFIPLPGTKSGPDLARVVLSLFMTFALFASWPVVHAEQINVATMIGWMLSEVGLGLALGLLAGFVAEVFQMGAQIIAIQAGYSFASTIDPSSGADSSVLITMAQLASGILFFATGLDRQVLLIFSHSLQSHPPGTFALSQSIVTQVAKAGSIIFSGGFRLVLPLVALLAMIDISLALLARLNAQLQLITLAFPIKMLTSLVLFAWLMTIFPRLFTTTAAPLFDLARRLFG